MPIGRSNRRAMIAGAAISSSRSKKRAAATPIASQPAPIAQPQTTNDDMFIQLEKLGALRDKGILTDDEFNAKKKQILGL